MTAIEPAARIRPNARGCGVAGATVFSRVPIGDHDMSGVAHRVTLELPNGERPDALHLGTERRQFVDPPYSIATS